MDMGSLVQPMTKLIIQIPCFNEAEVLPDTLAALPSTISGIDKIEVLVINDGSIDGTASVALEHGADYLVNHKCNQGLAQAFYTGINASLALGADIIVNTDGDHQYPGSFIPELIQPILDKRADVVIGNRNPASNLGFSPIKRILQVIGSWVVQNLSGSQVPDAASGFRAYSSYAASRIQVTNNFSYTLETLIQAGNDKMSVAFVPVETNNQTRPSRLHKGILNFIWVQAFIILRSYVLYQPLRTFGALSILFMSIGLVPWVRFLYLYLAGLSGIGRNIQSITIGGVLFIFGVLLLLLGLLGDAINTNRNVNIEILARMKVLDRKPVNFKALGYDLIIRDNSEK
jgi:glycosyltransferase involved in cell wall biosynthesis